MSEEIKVRIDWESDEDKVASYVNHLVVTFDGGMYTLRFYQVLPPAIVAINPATAANLESVKGRHVATLVVSPASMPQMVDVLHGVLERNSPAEQGK